MKGLARFCRNEAISRPHTFFIFYNSEDVEPSFVVPPLSIVLTHIGNQVGQAAPAATYALYCIVMIAHYDPIGRTSLRCIKMPEGGQPL
jgi:hypothetical protein